nr:BTAD domain-containing putative transcriptional regulator [uncultured Arsenicibacter sp.]
MAHSDRFIGFFSSTEERLWYMVVRMLAAEYSLYIADEHTVPQVKSAILQDDTSAATVEVLSSAEFLLREQVVRAQPVLDALRRKMAGLPPVRLTIFLEMTWAVRTPSGDIYLRELQEAFQSLLKENNQLTIVCLYNESVLLEEQLLLGLFSHPVIFTTEGARANPYYLPPQIIRKNYAKQRFDYWLSNIDPQRIAPALPAGKEGAGERKAHAVDKPFQKMVAQTDEGRWKIRCFGELRIRRENGESIDWNTKAGSTKKLKTIFAYLLLRGEKGATADELADLLWPEADNEKQALNRLYHAIRYLRAVLSGREQDTRQSSFVVQQSSIYYLRLPFDSWIDLPMFQELCFNGNQHIMNGNLEQGKICYEAAERLYSSDLFTDIPLKYIDNHENDWCWSKRTWYRDMFHKLLYSLARIHRLTGNLPQAISYCDKALDENPNLEEAHKEKMLALAGSQRFDALHRQYRIYTESLRKFNLGLPSEEIRLLYLNLAKKS